MHQLDPDRLLIACAAGDRRALATLYQSEASRMMGIAMLILRRRQAAEDAVQDAFVQAWTKAASFDPARGPARAWLGAIVRNRAISMLRRVEREVPEEAAGLAERADESTPDALSALAANADAVRLKRCLETLEEPARRSVLMAFVNGLSHSQIADRLAEPLGTVKSRIRRALLSLRECLA